MGLTVLTVLTHLAYRTHLASLVYISEDQWLLHRTFLDTLSGRSRQIVFNARCHAAREFLQERAVL